MNVGLDGVSACGHGEPRTRESGPQRQLIKIEMVLLILLSLGAGSKVLAHHSFAMFDHTRTLTLKGTVTKFQWTNPHAYIEMDVPGSDGKTTHFTIECTSINMMQRLGWRSNMIKAGDQVKATVAPLLSGQPGGLLLDVVLPDGRKLEPGVPGINTFKRTPEE
jgi:Family of unknown function (DUF6152)